jgi:hypothetical protein
MELGHTWQHDLVKVLNTLKPSGQIFWLWGKKATGKSYFCSYMIEKLGRDVIGYVCVGNPDNVEVTLKSINNKKFIFIESNYHPTQNYAQRLGLERIIHCT